MIILMRDNINVKNENNNENENEIMKIMMIMKW